MAKRTRAQWLALFAQHHNSGLSAAAFCRQHKLCPKYFSLRKKQLQWTPPVNVDPDQSAFVPTRVVPVRRDTLLTLQWQGVEPSFPSTASPNWLAQLMRELTG